MQADLREKRCQGTGEWILTHPSFRAWFEGDNPTLLFSGIPGGGKTFAASFAIEHLTSRCNSGNLAVAFVFCRHDMRMEQTTHHLLAAFLRQLSKGKPQLHPAIIHLDGECKKRRKPSIEELRDTILEVVRSYERVFIVVDGLDECFDWDGDIRLAFLPAIRYFQKNASVKLLATSRDIPIILEEFEGSVRTDIAARKPDVRKYVQSRRDMSRVVRSNGALQSQIAEDISEAVDGM